MPIGLLLLALADDPAPRPVSTETTTQAPAADAAEPTPSEKPDGVPTACRYERSVTFKP